MQNLTILTIGEVMAWHTCAGLLEKQVVTSLGIEKVDSDSSNGSGHMFGLLPLGRRVLTELDLRKAYYDTASSDAF